ncbi:MAG: HzsA-related protein [Limisphaerales bacterium]
MDSIPHHPRGATQGSHDFDDPVGTPLCRQSRVGRTVLVATLLAGAVWSSILSQPAAAARLEFPLLVTQIPRQTPTPAAVAEFPGLARADGFDQARLILVSPDGAARTLSEGFQSACDPNVSFDGQRVLFAGRRERDSRWRIWELGLDGQGLRAISPEHLDARNPIHASTLFTLDSPGPWFTTVFVGRESTLNELGQPSGSSLYNIKLDGTELRRMTFNPNHNLDPFQMWDGRIVYAAERYPNQPSDRTGRVGLYAIHVEGADMEFYGGGRGRRTQRMPCATEDGLVVFVESDDATGEGAGQLACVEERRPHVTYRPLTQDPSFAFLHPSPLRGSRLLVSRRTTDGKGSYGVFDFDTQHSVCEPLFDSPDHHDVQAVVAASRRLPDGHSTVVDTKADYGLFYGLNCYDADQRLAPHVKSGMVKRVRLIEGVLQPGAEAAQTSTTGPFVLRRLVGEAPVEADGSFNVEVPADTPLLLQTLDERGLALASCGWIWVKPKEKRGCIGCHEDPERIPENEYVLALRRPSNRLLLPPGDRRAIAFREDIAPLLQKHCATAECHGGSDTPLALPLSDQPLTEPDLRKVYATLLVPADGAASGAPGTLPEGKYVDAGRARTSWLVWQLTGEDTSRPWDHAAQGDKAGSRKVTSMPPPGKGAPLSAEQVRTLIQWIDMGAQYAAPAAVQNPSRLSSP